MNATEVVIQRPSIGIGRSTRMLWTLYMKDLRQLAGICLSLIVLTHFIRSIPWLNYQIFSFGNPVYKMVYIFPTVLAYMLYENHHNGSVYLQQSLPVSPGLSILTLYGALLTYVWVYAVLVAGTDALTYVVTHHESYTEYLARFNKEISFWHLYTLLFQRNIRSSSLGIHVPFYSGIVCLATGIVHPTPGQARLRYWAGFIGVIMLILGIFALFNRFDLRWHNVLGAYTYLLVGTTFAVIGALLYHRYGEV